MNKILLEMCYCVISVIVQQLDSGSKNPINFIHMENAFLTVQLRTTVHINMQTNSNHSQNHKIVPKKFLPAL